MPSASTRRVLLSEVRVTPWKNGGGVTREIATGAALGPGGNWGWRISIAEVEEDGPFSTFPGTDRVMAVIAGKGMDLHDPEGAVFALEPYHPVRISGDDRLHGRLRGGPVRNLNVMTARGQFQASLEIRQGPHSGTLECGGLDCLLIHSLEGTCPVRTGDGRAHDLAAAESLVHEGQGRLDLQLLEGTRAAVVSLRPCP